MAEAGGYAALRALVRLEMRRILPSVGRSLAVGGVVTAVIVVSGAFTVPRLAFIVACVGAVPVMGFPINALRDKLDGGLEFLRLLPVSPGTQAMGRLLALAGVAIPGAMIAAVAVVLALPGDVADGLGARNVGGIFLAVMFLMVGGGSLMTALVLRFEAQQMNYAVVAVIGSGMVFDHVAGRFLPDPLGAFVALTARAWFLPALWTTGVLLVGGVGWFAFSLARAGIARFSPPRDRITW